MWADLTRQALTDFEDASTEEETFAALSRFGKDVGADFLSYHHIDRPSAILRARALGLIES